MKADPPVSSRLIPPRDPNGRMVSTGSCVGPNTPKCSLLHRRFHRGKRDMAVWIARSGIICEPVVCIAIVLWMLHTALCVAVRGRLGNNTTAFCSPRVSGCCFYVARRVLRSLDLLSPLAGPKPVLLFLQDGAVLCGVSCSLAVGALHITTVVPRHLHGNAATCDRLRVERTRKVVDVHGVYHVPDVVHPEVSPLVASGWWSLVFNGKGT